MALSDVEVRVLGALIEKERTTPDGYPLSSSALLAACNQRTSRDPVTDYHLQDVLAAVTRLSDRGLAETVRTEADRVAKHRHKAVGALGLDDHEAAVLAVLLLRGEQTPGELRSRTERYVTFSTVAAVEAVLDRLSAREPALAVRRPRGPGQSQDRYLHCLGEDPSKLAPRVRRAGSAGALGGGRAGSGEALSGSGADGDADSYGDVGTQRSVNLAALERRIAELERRVDALTRATGEHGTAS